MKINRWFTVLTAWILIFFSAASTIFSVFSGAYGEVFGWEASKVNLGFTIYIINLGIFGILGGVYIDKKKAAPMLYVGGMIFASGFLLSGFVTEIWQFYLTFGVMGGLGAGLIYNPSFITALRHFPDKKGLVSGLLLGAAALGPFLLAPFVKGLLGSSPYSISAIRSTFLILGIVFLVGVLSLTWMMKTVSKPRIEIEHPNEMNYKQMLKKPFFWLLFIVFAAAGTAGNMMISSIAKIAENQYLLTGFLLSIVVSVSTLSNFIGRQTFGLILDKIGYYKGLTISLIGTIIALLLLAQSNTPVIFFIAVMLLGATFGAILVIFPSLTSYYFGMKNQGLNYGIMFLAYSVAGMIGPLVAGYFEDTTGSFRGAYYVGIAIAAVGLAITTGLAIYEQKYRSFQVK
ncbi:MAG: MFS transporter [Acholeplasmataceae bacterium]